MKGSHFIAPALALIGSVLLVGRQESTLSVLREKTRVVQERLGMVVAARSDDVSFSPEAGETVPKTDMLSLPDGSPDWEAIFKLTAKALKEGGFRTNLTQLPEFQKRIAEMSEDEIAEGMARIGALDFDEKSRQKLEVGLLFQLARKNPQKTLELIGDAISERKNPLSWIQRIAYSKFVKSNPAAAMAWLDHQINEGKLYDTSLHPGSNPRFELEGKLIGQLIATDPTTALSRVSTYSEAEKRQLFGYSSWWFRNGEMPVGFLTLAREALSEDGANSAIAYAWSVNSIRDLTGVDESLKEISFSDKERVAIIERSVNNYTQDGEFRNDYETAYEWAAKRDPHQAASAIAKALLDGGSSGYSFDEKFEKSMQLAEKFDNPSLLTEFARLHNPNRSDQKFKDPALLEKMNELRKVLSQKDE